MNPPQSTQYLSIFSHIVVQKKAATNKQLLKGALEMRTNIEVVLPVEFESQESKLRASCNS
jgi:hypothetical protein